MAYVGNIVYNPRWLIPSNGNIANPALSFFSSRHTGFSRVFSESSNVAVSVQGLQKADVNADLRIVGNLTANSYVGNGSGLIPAIQISTIQVANSSYGALDDTAVSTDGGFVVINGSNFGPGTIVTVGSTLAPAITFVSSSKLHVQVPIKVSGSYTLEATRPDGKTAVVPLGVTYSPFPAWSTSSTLANVDKYTSFTQTLSATEALGSNITYTVANGSSLPANVTLASNGILSGNILADPGNTTTYSFSVNAIDAQYQNIPRTFGLTALNALITATGGTITYSGGYTIHTFTTSGTFTLSSIPTGKTFDVLVVAGGGSGGTNGGGGGGGVIYMTSIFIANGTYSITVGGGGNNSQFSSYTAIAGGSGGAIGIPTNTTNNGGSGGGGGAYVGGGYGGGTGTGGQGNNGGSGGFFDGQRRCGGGGGGAGTVGGNAVQSDRGAAGSGGSGIQVWGAYYGGGGGGSSEGGGGPGYAGGGGLGGGGGGVGWNVASPVAGTVNTGGGGGGGGGNAGAAGGSGIVVIRYIP